MIMTYIKWNKVCIFNFIYLFLISILNTRKKKKKKEGKGGPSLDES